MHIVKCLQNHYNNFHYFFHNNLLQLKKAIFTINKSLINHCEIYYFYNIINITITRNS